MIAVVLPDGGRAYLSKIFNDTWMASHGMLERTSDRTVGDVLRAKQAAGEIPPLVVVETQQKVKDAIALLHEHRVSQLPVVSHTDPGAVVGSIGERGLLKHAADNPGIMATPIVDVMEPPFPAVAATDPVREAVELLTGDRQALLVTERGRPNGIVTRADLLEALVS
jgi:cystathionine beta-synthase